MKAITATTSLDRPEAALFPRWSGPKCEQLFDIFNAELGRVYLGRMLSGNDAGRLVALRSLPSAPSAELAAAVDLARSIAHPRLAKTLGVLRVDDSWQLASEYIPGVTLFELGQVLTARGERVSAPVAVRVVLDMLAAVVAARRLLLETANVSPDCCIFPESVWLAEFGETFLAEISASAILAQSAHGVADEAQLDESGEARDVRAAGLQLLELACGSSARSALQDPLVPEVLRRIAARATSTDSTARFASVRAFAEALADLEPGLLASEEDVSAELRRLMGPVLDLRRQKISMTERVSSQECEQDETRFFRAAVALAQRKTARPPGKRTVAGAQAQKQTGRQPGLTRSEPPEEPTTVFRRRNRGTDSSPDIVLEAQEPMAQVAPSAVLAAHAAPSSHAPLAAAPASLGMLSAKRRRMAWSLLLLAALIAFVLTSSPELPLGRGLGKPVAHSSLRWLQSQAGNVWHRLR